MAANNMSSTQSPNHFSSFESHGVVARTVVPSTKFVANDSEDVNPTKKYDDLIQTIKSEKLLVSSHWLDNRFAVHCDFLKKIACVANLSDCAIAENSPLIKALKIHFTVYDIAKQSPRTALAPRIQQTRESLMQQVETFAQSQKTNTQSGLARFFNAWKATSNKPAPSAVLRK